MKMDSKQLQARPSKSPKRKRPKIGDVVRVSTPAGAAFAQYTHKHPTFGPLVRVIGPAESTSDPAIIAERPTQFLAFFPLGAACLRGIAEIIGSAPVPRDLTDFPHFRQPLRLDPAKREGCNWLIWNGHEEWKVPELSREQRTYPLRQIINDTLLVDRALAGWKPVDEQ